MNAPLAGLGNCEACPLPSNISRSQPVFGNCILHPRLGSDSVAKIGSESIEESRSDSSDFGDDRD